jgi:hypothetical protein
MSAGHLPSMSNAAFAGFLRLLLTPLNEAPRPSGELRAYLDYLSRIHPPAPTAPGGRSKKQRKQAA